MKTLLNSLYSFVFSLGASKTARGLGLPMLFALLVLPVSTFTSPAQCLDIFSQSEQAEVSLLQWEGQIELRKYRHEFNTLDGLSYSYTTAKDTINYEALSSALHSRLSKAETEMLTTYTTMSGYTHGILNSYIAKKDTLKGTKAKRVNTLLAAFDKGVYLPEGLLLFRGIAGNPFDIPAAGKTMQWDRLTSTSMNPDTARYFTTEGEADQGILFVIEIGSPVKALLSKNPLEMEFLLPPDTTFTVISKKRIRPENILIVHLKANPK